MTFANHTSDFLLSVQGIVASVTCAMCCLLYNYCSNSTCLKFKGKNKRSIDALKEKNSFTELKKRNVEKDYYSNPYNDQYLPDVSINPKEIEAKKNEELKNQKEIFGITSAILNIGEENTNKKKNIHFLNDSDNCVTKNEKINFSDFEETKNNDAKSLHSECKENVSDNKGNIIEKNMLEHNILVDFYSENKVSCINDYNSFNIVQKEDPFVNDALMCNSLAYETNVSKRNAQYNYEQDCYVTFDDQLTDNFRYLSSTSIQDMRSLKTNKKNVDIKKNHENDFVRNNNKPYKKQNNNFSYIPKNVNCFSKKTNYYKEYNSPGIERNMFLEKTEAQNYDTETNVMRFSKILRSYSSFTTESQKYVNIKITSEEELSSEPQSSNYAESMYSSCSTYNNCFISDNNDKKEKFDTKFCDIMPYDEKNLYSQYFVKKNKACKSEDNICNYEGTYMKESKASPPFLQKTDKIYYKKSHTSNSWSRNCNEIRKKRIAGSNKNIKGNILLKYMSEDSSFNKQLPKNKHVLKHKSANNICVLKYVYENLISCKGGKMQNSEDRNKSSVFQNNNLQHNVESKCKTYFKNIKPQKNNDKIKSSMHAGHRNRSVYIKKYVNNYAKKKFSKKTFPFASSIKKTNQNEDKIKKSINKKNIINVKKNENKKMSSCHRSSNDVGCSKCFRNENLKKCKDKLAHENSEAVKERNLFDSKCHITSPKKKNCFKNTDIFNSCDLKHVTQNKSTQNAECNYVRYNLTDEDIRAKQCSKNFNKDFDCIEPNKSIIFSTEKKSQYEEQHQKNDQIDMHEEKLEKQLSKELTHNQFDISFPLHSRIPTRSANTEEKIYCDNKKYNTNSKNGSNSSSSSSNVSRSCSKDNNVNKKKKNQNIYDCDETTSTNVDINKTQEYNSNEINTNYNQDNYKNVKEQIFEYLQNSINTYNLGGENKIRTFIKKEKRGNTSDDVLVRDVKFDCQKNVNIIGFLKKKLIENNESGTEDATETQNKSDGEEGKEQVETQKSKQRENQEQEKINEHNKCGKQRKTKYQQDGNTPSKHRDRLLKNKNDVNKNSKKNKFKIEKLIKENKYTEMGAKNIDSAESKKASNKTLKGNKINSEKKKEAEKGKEMEKDMGKGKSKGKGKGKDNDKSEGKDKIKGKGKDNGKNKEKCKDDNIEKEVAKDTEKELGNNSEKKKEQKLRTEKEKEKEKSSSAKEKKNKRKIENIRSSESSLSLGKKSKRDSTDKENLISPTTITDSFSKTKEKSIRKTKKVLITEDITESNKNENTLSLNDKEKLKAFCKKYKDIGTNRCASGLTKFIFFNVLKQKEESFEDLLTFVLQLQKIFRMSTPDYVELLLFIENNLEILKKYSVKECILVAMHSLKGESTDKSMKTLVKILKLDNYIVEKVTACFFKSKKQITTTEVEVDRILNILSSVVIRRSSRIKQVFNTTDSNSNTNTKTELKMKKSEEKDKEEALGSCWDPIYI